jgi:hypothetical protein
MQFDDFLKVVDLLKDPAQYEAKIAELQARQDAIQASIMEMGIKGDIAKAQSKADALIAKADLILANANADAQTIISNAQAVFDKRHADLQLREVIADQAMADYNTMKNQFTTRSEELRTGEKALATARAQLQADQADLASKQLEVEQRLDKLRQVMN